MRVIAGSWKGRRLKSPASDAVRPTTDRVKEALFNILGPDVTGCLFVDLCCGAGGLGIEALSRGAAGAIFVDQAPRSLNSARANLEICGADFEQIQLVKADAVSWLEGFRPPEDGRRWILVADPPYLSGAAGAIMVGLARLASDPGLAAAVIEHGPRTPDLPDHQEGGLTWTIRRYGESRLAVARPPQPVVNEGE